MMRRTLVTAVRTEAQMTTSLSFFWRSLPLAAETAMMKEVGRE